MKILAAEDHAVARTLLCRALRQLGHEVVEAVDGARAWTLFQADPVRVVVSDWMMPQLDGLELCRRIRARPDADYVYFILLTQLDANAENKHAAADAGVDDFLHKPLNADELWMRLRTAERIIEYATRVRQLERLLPICSYCKKIRSDQNYWQDIEAYLLQHSGSHFSHSVCPDCYQRIVIPQLLEAGIRPPPLPPS
jgi:DNA-binding response OmpR family regulator